MSKVYIVAAKRSAVGKFLGGLSTVPAGELAGQVIKAVIDETGIDPKNIDEVVLGNVLPGGQRQNLARQASIFAGVPVEVPAYSVNILCGSGMKTIMTAYNEIKAGEANLVVAGGVEVMSQAPFIAPSTIRNGNKMGELALKDTLLYDGLTDAFHNYHMGVTAENIAERYGISRESQDHFAARSQRLAVDAMDNGKFVDEIVPVEVKTRKGTVVVKEDEHPNRSTNFETLQKLKPAFKAGGTVTAGNASGINDGASIFLIASEEAVNKYGLKPMVEIVAIGQGGVDPSVMGLGPVPAIENVLSKTELNIRDIELIELNEAFAAQALGVMEELKKRFDLTDEWFDERTNVNGSAIALGHPLGASGARITTTLIYEMKRRNATYGLASLCIGGGMGTAIIVKSI